MSYILEALRKAERERNAGAPDLQGSSRHPSASSTRPLMRQRLTVGAAVIAGLLIGTVLWLRSTHAPDAAPEAPAPIYEPAPIAEAPPANIAETNPTGGAARLDDLLDKGSPGLPLEEQHKLSTISMPTAATLTTVEPIATTESAPTLAEQATAEPELPPELKKLKEMPTDYRGNFPPIRVDVHAYDEQPARRFVMINGRKYREGEVLAEGPTVVSIEEDGIVFNYNNQEVLYPLAR